MEHTQLDEAKLFLGSAQGLCGPDFVLLQELGREMLGDEYEAFMQEAEKEVPPNTSSASPSDFTPAMLRSAEALTSASGGRMKCEPHMEGVQCWRRRTQAF